MKPFFQGYGGAKYAFGALVLLLGVIGIALPAAFLGTEGPVAQAYVAKLASVGEDTGQFPNAITGALAGGAVCAAGGLLVILSGALSKGQSQASRGVMAVGLLVGLVGGIIMIAMGVSLSANPLRKNLGPETYEYNADRAPGGKKGGTLPANQELHKIFSLAAFEKCCFNKGYFAQTLFGPCGTTCPGPQSGTLLDSRIDIIIDLIDPTDLCTCVKDQAAYTAMLAKIDEGTCSLLNKARIFFEDSLTIPTTTIKVSTLKSQLFPNTKVIKVPIVGWHLAPELDTSGLTETGYGFGCGLGYLKGIMWIQAIYYDQNIAPLGSQFAGVGGGAIGVVVFTLVVFAFLAFSDDDAMGANWDQSMAAKWQNDNVATGVLATPQMQQNAQVYQAPQQQQAPPLQQQQQGGLVAQNPTYRGAPQQQAPPPQQQGGGGDFSAQLRAFYRQYDPKKTEADVATISAWARQNGLQALNNKLRAKYGADLSGDAGPPI